MTDQRKDFLHELLATFRVEAQEHLHGIAAALVALEGAEAGARGELLDRLLKTLHTLKGAARAVDQSAVERLCHALESVFSALRQAGCAPGADQFDLLHQAAGLARRLLDEPRPAVRNQAAALAARLESLAAEMTSTPAPDSAAAIPATATAPTDVQADPAPATGAPSLPQQDLVRVHADSLDTIRRQAEALLGAELRLQHQVAELMALADDMDESMGGRPLAGTPAGNPDPALAARCRRIAAGLARTRASYAGIRGRLMDATLDTALVPFSSALASLPALVRQLARGGGKEAALEIEGGGMQVDRRILGIARDALIHLVTNAVDHGLEDPARRLAAGKPRVGTIRISVTQPGSNRIAVTVADDGAGMDGAAIGRAALQAGQLDQAELGAMDRDGVLRLALRSGVSTTARVTPVSGRGVGLAIVAEQVASIGGELAIASEAGAGSHFELQLPVRLATMRGLVLRTRGVRHVLPLAAAEKVRALREGDIRTVEGRETLLLGGRVMPVIRLGDLFAVPADGAEGDGGHGVAAGVAVVVRAAGQVFALLVDEIESEQEVLPKSLGKQLRRVRYFSGAAQLGDGGLVLILAPEDLARHGLRAAGTAGVAVAPRPAAEAPAKLLVVEDSITSRLLLKHILEGAGYRVETATDGLDALSRMRQETFDAVISDVEMPRMDGLSLTERIRANPQTEDLPVVLVTSLQSPQEKERGLLAGADAYVVKGAFDQDGLLKTIRRLT